LLWLGVACLSIVVLDSSPVTLARPAQEKWL
jgi:hypothetical protein